ncbi:MAG: HpcH/HpaI aldolase/citrate lyase family protein [Flexilinea sp.]
MTIFKEKVRNREVVLGTMISEMSTANVVRIMKAAGFEFIIVDCEHGYFDFSQLANIVSVGNGFNMPVIVRIPAIEREFVTKVLDMGSDGVLVPMINTVADAKKVVELVKYPPMGLRGISTTRAHTNYNPPALDEYIKIANEKTMIFVQIETKLGVENAERIAAVEGVNALMVGPNDLAVDMGAPGHLETPEMDYAITQVIVATGKANKSCGIIDSHMGFLKKWQCRNMNIFSCSSEVGMMMKSAKTINKEFNER